jgi:hypothetical protein
VPIVALGYNLVQQKIPIYGFWSFTFDAVALGTRIVQGSFAIPFQGPQYMYYLLKQAALNKDAVVTKAGFPYTEDDINISRYWGVTRDDKFPAVKHLLRAGVSPRGILRRSC